MHETKCRLIDEFGLRCMLCKQEKKLYELQWHHIKPKYASIREGKQADNSFENASLLCVSCHQLVHQYDFDDLRYKAMMLLIEYYKKNPDS